MQSVCIYSWPAPELGIGTYVLRDPAITKAKNMWADDQEIFLNLLLQVRRAGYNVNKIIIM